MGLVSYNAGYSYFDYQHIASRYTDSPSSETLTLDTRLVCVYNVMNTRGYIL